MNSEQLRFFKTFGYILLPQHVNADTLVQLARDHEDALAAQYPAERNDGSERLWTRMTDEGTPFTAEFRVVAPAVSPVGVPDPVAIKPGIAEFITTNVTVKAG